MNPYVLEIIDALEDAVIFEFGCFDGSDTHELARNGFKKFYTFEPDPRNIERIEAAGLPEGVRLVKKAVGANVGKTFLYQSTNFISGHGVWSGSSSIRPPSSLMREVSPSLKFDSRVEVEVTTLDAFCAEEGIEQIDFIWADIQGAERDLVAGGEKMIPRTHYLFMEHEKFKVYDGQWDYEEMLAALPNFEVVEKFPNDILLKNKSWPV